jgi:hypothetical protein
MPHHTITELYPNQSPSWTTFGKYCSPRCLHTYWRPSRCVRGNLDLSVKNTGLHWQLTWLRTNRRRAVRCCCIERDTRTGRLGHKDTSLNLFLTLWSDTVTFLRSCCSSLAVAERRHNAQMVRYRSSCGVVMHPPPCELACLIEAIPQAVNITDGETLRSTATRRKVHPSWIKVKPLRLEPLMGCTGLRTMCSNDSNSLCTSRQLTYAPIFTLFWHTLSSKGLKVCWTNIGTSSTTLTFT